MKKRLYNMYGLIHTLKYPATLFASIQAMFDERVYENKEHLKTAGEWLLYMQNEDGGYSRKFSFITGRDQSYIETTGYIIPSMIRLGEYLGERKFIHSGLKAGEFLLQVQNEDGSFSDIDTRQPFVFDTGQCLTGLNFLYEYSNDTRYLNALQKAAYWLKEVQEKDGSWERFSYNTQTHTYYSRVAAAMLKSAYLLKDKELEQAALQHVAFVLRQQQPNGFFAKSSFIEGIAPYLHTLMYVLEGLLDIYDMMPQEEILQAVLKNAERFAHINLHRDLILCSQYDSEFRCVNHERCITGLAQWAGVALRLYALTNDERFLKSAVNTLFYVKAKQIKSSSMRGGFSASIPFWGRYGSFDFVNWNNKFFIDALLAYETYDISMYREQESFVGAAFNRVDVVTDEMSFMDKEYLKRLRKVLPKNQKIKVLDVGCGKGVIIKRLQEEFPLIEFIGVDPVFEDAVVQKGSVYELSFADESIDYVLLFEVLQHTYMEKALQEVYRVLKPGGKVMIGERNKISILGVLKPFFELSGTWMYPYDAPFREKWYSKRAWKEMLKRSGFEMKRIETIEGAGKPYVNRYVFIEGEK